MTSFRDTLTKLVANAEKHLGVRVFIEWVYDEHADENERWSCAVRPVARKIKSRYFGSSGIEAMQRAAAHFAKKG